MRISDWSSDVCSSDLLAREGLAFGAGTNAATGFESTVYMLNLPRNDAALLDTALMLMRETASELTIEQAAVDRGRGVVMAERRERRTFAYRSEEHTSELQSLMRISYTVFCLKKK